MRKPAGVIRTRMEAIALIKREVAAAGRWTRRAQRARVDAHISAAAAESAVSEGIAAYRRAHA
jgi:hypothetical protein